MEAVPIRPQEPTPALDLRDLLAILWRERRRVLGAVLAAGVLTLAVSFVLPRWYGATAVILPPEESDLLQNLSLAQRALTKFPAFGVLPDYFTPADIFLAVLGSRTVREDVIAKYDLQRVYRLKSIEKTLKELKGHTRVKLNADGTIIVQVEDRDPARAAGMANTYLVALDRYNVEKRNTQARRTRQFLESRVAETDSLLRVSEQALRAYQERRHTVAPVSIQGAGDVQGAADLMTRKFMLEVRLGVLRGYLSEENDQVVQVRNELEQLRKRIGSLPAMQDEIQRLVRDQKIQEQLFLLLTAELEQARLRETMDTPTVQILDPAVPSERASRPRKLILTLGAMILAFVGTAVVLYVREGRTPVPRA